jgi:hypothetical protein
MHSWRKFLDLTNAEHMLLFRAFRSMCWVSLRLRFHSPDWLKTRLREEVGVESRSHGFSPEQITMAVDRASRFVPGWTCLVSAIAAQQILLANGWPAVIRLGVLNAREPAFKAHAWVEINGHIFVGASGAAGYTPLNVMRK